MIPQLRVRTEFNFRQTFGPIDRVAKRLEEIEAPFAAIVDKGAWGHTYFEKAVPNAGFGCEFVLPTEDGRSPVCWALAEDTRAFYRFASSAPSTEEAFAGLQGVVRFAGAALTDPETFDYIDLNPRSLRSQREALALHKKTGKPLVVTCDNDFPSLSDRDAYLAIIDSKKMTPQHILDDAEMRAAFPLLDDATFAAGVRGCHEVAERLSGIKLQKAPLITVDGDLVALVEAGRAFRLAAGHIDEWTPEYQTRLEREMAMIKSKAFESYFLVVADLVTWAKTRMLVGPARGSSAGSLVCYLLRITEVDPMVYGLLFERFIDINRPDLPDIDIDFSDTKRPQTFEYLGEKYGKDNFARIGNVNRLKPKSGIAQVAKNMALPFGSTFALLNVLVEHASGSSLYGHALEEAMRETDAGQAFMRRYPEMEAVTEIENHAWHTGVHAAGAIVSTEPVIDFCVVLDGVAQLDKPATEYLNLLKIDVLGLRTLGVIEDAGVVTADELYALKLDDPEVLAIFNTHRYAGIFQFEGAAQRRVAETVHVDSFKQIDHVTALARPGPLGGGAAQHYIARADGKEPVTFRHPSMERYLGETLGVVLYQEQVMNISREIGKFPWEVVSEIRKAMSARKGPEYFNRRGEEFFVGAMSLGLSREEAETIWSEICTFGAWGMNKSHTVSYAVISYWCAWMKRYHPMEYAAACLRSAKDEEQTIEILREFSAEGIGFIPFDPHLSEANWSAKDGKLVGGFNNLIGIGPVKAAAYVNKRETAGLDDKDIERLSKLLIKNQDLRPAHTKWGHLYADPTLSNVRGRIKEFGELADFEDAVVICRVISRKRRDENEAVLIAKREGVVKPGFTLFLDAFVVDDSVSKPITLRFKPDLWEAYGLTVAEDVVDGQDWFLVRGRWLKTFSMMIAKKVRCLTRPELFDDLKKA